MIIDALSLRLLTAHTPKNSWRTLAGVDTSRGHVHACGWSGETSTCAERAEGHVGAGVVRVPNPMRNYIMSKLSFSFKISSPKF
jgi:hypothetical protein